MKTEKEFLINLVNKTIEFLASKLKEKHKKDEESKFFQNAAHGIPRHDRADSL